MVDSKKINSYSRRYELDSNNGVYDKIANNSEFKKILGEVGDSLLVRGNLKDLLIVGKNKNTNKEIIKIHSIEPEQMQSKLENITGVKFSQYRIH